MLVEILYFEGCPSHERLLPTVERLAGQVGAQVALRRVETAEDADTVRFLGSPTVRVDGVDIEPGADERSDYGLKCRLYRTPEGLSGEPAESWLVDLLATGGARSQPDARTAEPGALGGVLSSPDRWASNRLSGLGPDERRLYDSILRSFLRGQDPSAEELAEVDGSGHAIRTLVERDLVQLGSGGEVTVAYPFSARPTRHRVRLRDGLTLWAMCAVDALGVPFLVRQPAEIEAHEPAGDRAISVTVDPLADTLRWSPAGAVVVAAPTGDGRIAGCVCPHINFFASKDAAKRHLAQPGLHGTILTVPEATLAGRTLFGDLLDRLADLEDR